MIGTSTETWAYDKNGNRTIDTKTGTANVYNAYNGADQLCWAGPSAGTCASPPGGAVLYGYDANGNTTTAGATTQSYNVFDQLLRVAVFGGGGVFAGDDAGFCCGVLI